MADFGSLNNSFQLISFDANLLGSYFNAQSVTRTVAAIQTSSRRIERGPAVITPWDLADNRDAQTLAGKFNAVRGKSNFIDLNVKNVTQTRNKDERALFALYQALNDLKTIADYSADKNTPTALLANLNNQFRDGLGQVQDYIRGAEMDKLSLIFGEKLPRVESEVNLGKNKADIIGATLPVNSKTQIIPGLTGTEVFTINLDKITANDNITVDLSQMTTPLTLGGLVTFINQQINAVTVTDANGNPVKKYKSSVAAEEVSTGKFALKFNVIGGEKVTLTAQVSEPALYITGTQKDAGLNKVETGTLTKIRDLGTSLPLTEFSRQVAGTDQANFIPPPLDKNGNPVAVPDTVFDTTPAATAADSQGNVYVVGSSKGDFGSQINAAGVQDVFLSKYDAGGNLLFSRLLGASGTAKAFDIAIDSSDNVIIAGQVDNELTATDTFSGFDSFVTKYDKVGLELWTYQQDTIAEDQANSLAIDAAGDVYVTGSITGRLNATTTAGGGSDVFVTKLSGLTGTLTSATQIGGTGTEFGQAVAIAGDGNILVASKENGRAILRKLDVTNLSSQLATYDLGNLNEGTISDIAVDSTTGDIFVAGTSFNGALSGGTVTNAYSGGGDGFVTKLTDGGTSLSASFTYFLGSGADDKIEGLSVQNGAIYVAGKTRGTLPGAVKSGITDGFAAKINATTGTADFIRQFSGSGNNGSTSLAFSASGSSILTKLGLPTGLVDNKQTRNIETQTSARAGDYFFISVNGGAARKVSINAGDDFKTLARRISRVSFRFVKASEAAGLTGKKLKIESFNGSTVDIIAGKGARDALVKLGLQPSKILPASKLSTIGDASLGTDPNNLGGVFGLDLKSGYALRTKTEAAFVSAQLDTALTTIKRAFRSLTFDPVKADLLKQANLSKGTVPPYLTKQLANYQDGLQRLSFLGNGGGFSI
ncbi:hypothetical protein MNBD_ALPHA02-939 [hydrothermal vent metagenome]|uniref:Uncharacterized protein n=1 Tax=hydrothermal vent metagenome TaxID=652676 RepID=A0A3B0RHN4_9ZZZZ